MAEAAEAVPREKLRRLHRELLLRYAVVHDSELHKVGDHLFIGSLGGAITSQTLHANGVTHILCVSSGVKERVLQRKAPNTAVMVSELRDTCEEPAAFLSALPALLSFIAAALEGGGTVLVCSLRGRSRASAVVIAHLVLFAGFSMRDAAARVSTVRPCAAPNAGFARALEALEAAVVAERQVSGLEAHTDNLAAFVDTALSVLPDLSRIEVSLEQLDLTKGLHDLSMAAVAQEVAHLQALFDRDAAEIDAEVEGDANPRVESAERDDSVPETLQPSGPDGKVADIVALEAAKAKAVACEDFAEAGRLRDQIHVLREAATNADISGASVSSQTIALLQAERVELFARKQKAVDQEDFELAAQVRDELKRVEETLRGLDAPLEFVQSGSTSMAGNEVSIRPGNATMPREHEGGDMASMAELLRSLQSCSDEGLDRSVVRANGGARATQASGRTGVKGNPSESDRLQQLLATLQTSQQDTTSRQHTRELTIWQKCAVYPVVLVLVLIILMVLHTVLLRVALYIVPDSE